VNEPLSGHADTLGTKAAQARPTQWPPKLKSQETWRWVSRTFNAPLLSFRISTGMREKHAANVAPLTSIANPGHARLSCTSLNGQPSQWVTIPTQQSQLATNAQKLFVHLASANLNANKCNRHKRRITVNLGARFGRRAAYHTPN